MRATTHRRGQKSNQADNWALMKFSAAVGDCGLLTLEAMGGGGNIAAIMLVPELDEAPLGLLSAFGLLRRGE